MAQSVSWHLHSPADYSGQVIRGEVDSPVQTTYLAVRSGLYVVEQGKPSLVQSPPEPGAVLSLAPGGRLVAWLIPSQQNAGFALAELHNLSDRSATDLLPPGPPGSPYFFDTIHVGYEGKLVVTATPLDDWQGLEGRYRYVFWTARGVQLESIDMKKRPDVVLDSRGTALLFIEERETTAYSNRGELLWRVQGQFRKAALSEEADCALLNPRDRIQQVIIVRRNPSTGQPEPNTIEFPTPIHRLDLSADGRFGLVSADAGRYFLLNPQTGSYQEGPPISEGDSVFRISDSAVTVRNTVVLGVQRKQSKSRSQTWSDGEVVVVRTEPDRIWRYRLPLHRPLAAYPGIVVTGGQNVVIGFTPDAVVRIELQD